jgi:hypothetical protein
VSLSAGEPSDARAAGVTVSRRPAWPVTALLVGYPLWWAAGIADFMWIILAVPMTARMIGWRIYRSRPLRVPRGFGLWLLFLVCAFAGGAVLGLTAPGTAPSPVSHRVLSYVNRNASYVGITILLLYAGNLTRKELPSRRLAWMLGLVAIYATIGGVAGMLGPHLQFSSPLEMVLPQRLLSNPFIHAVTHPALAQLQDVLGNATANARPKAPFDYTNTWGNCLTLLMPWLVVGWWYAGTRRERLLAGSAMIVAGAPLLYSLNRGAWVGAALSVAYVVLRLVARRPRALIRTLCVGLLLVGVIVLATPLRTVVAARLAHPQSNDLRASLSAMAVTDALSSPIIGYGDTRKQQGSLNTIARGPTQKCPLCGQQAVGSTGQFWLLLVSNGLIATALYLGFFIAGIWRFRRDRTLYGQAGVLVLGLSVLYMFTYDAVPAPLGFTMLAYALLWRNEMHHRQQYIRRSIRLPHRPSRRLATTAETAA